MGKRVKKKPFFCEFFFLRKFTFFSSLQNNKSVDIFTPLPTLRKVHKIRIIRIRGIKGSGILVKTEKKYSSMGTNPSYWWYMEFE